MELEITWARVWRIWWAHLWRNLLTILAATAATMVIGTLVVLFLTAFGLGDESIGFVSMSIGVVIGLLASVIPLRLILGKNFGEFRLVLLPVTESSDAQQRAAGDAQNARA